MEAEFKVGDRVRVKRFDDNESVRGAIGEIVVNDGDTYRPLKIRLDNQNLEGGSIWRNPSDLESAHKFKVGDRVRVTDPRLLCVGTPVGALATVTRVHDSGTINFDLEHPSHGVIDQMLLNPHEYLELAAPLRIEAGKFYKTRDGRKVGPMVAGWVGFYDARHLYTGYDWNEDGSFIKGDICNLDLIEEWTTADVFSPPSDCAEYGAPKTGETKPKFKVGDRVRVVKDGYREGGGSGHTTEIGAQVTLTRWCDRFRSTTGQDFYEHEIELVAPSTPAIVCLIEHGQPKPATRPYVHADRASAEREAARLAKMNTGQEFGVYELVSTAKEAKVHDHEWQRLAVGGEKISAIKELRSGTGLTLKGAKDAIEHWMSFYMEAA
jgi:hypothetical protein